MSTLSFDCRFRYPTGFALDLAFRAEQGVTALIGPSGSGKTTALLLIAGLLRPHAGRIELGKRVLFDAQAGISLPPEERRVGLVFQDFQLFPHLTVEENLRFGLRRNRHSRLDFGHAVEILELGPFLRRYPLTLSGGQRQRTALGRAVLQGPELLLLDEPLSALDDELRTSILGFLGRVIREYQIPTLLVTHDARNIEQLAQQRIYLLREAGTATPVTGPQG